MLRRRRTKEVDSLNAAARMTPGFWQADVNRRYGYLISFSNSGKLLLTAVFN
jgi:hypothetical protein